MNIYPHRISLIHSTEHVEQSLLVKNQLGPSSRFDRTLVRDRQTDGQRAE